MGGDANGRDGGEDDELQFVWQNRGRHPMHGGGGRARNPLLRSTHPPAYPPTRRPGHPAWHEVSPSQRRSPHMRHRTDASRNRKHGRLKPAAPGLVGGWVNGMYYQSGTYIPINPPKHPPRAQPLTHLATATLSVTQPFIHRSTQNGFTTNKQQEECPQRTLRAVYFLGGEGGPVCERSGRVGREGDA